MNLTNKIPLRRGEVNELAQEIGIHVNTLRYRWKNNDMATVEAVRKFRLSSKNKRELAMQEKQKMLDEEEQTQHKA